MAKVHDRLCYHGRRSVDELVVALNAPTGKVARAHRELSRLHLDRFVRMMATATDMLDKADGPGVAAR